MNSFKNLVKRHTIILSVIGCIILGIYDVYHLDVFWIPTGSNSFHWLISTPFDKNNILYDLMGRGFLIFTLLIKGFFYGIFIFGISIATGIAFSECYRKRANGKISISWIILPLFIFLFGVLIYIFPLIILFIIVFIYLEFFNRTQKVTIEKLQKK